MSVGQTGRAVLALRASSEVDVRSVRAVLITAMLALQNVHVLHMVRAQLAGAPNDNLPVGVLVTGPGRWTSWASGHCRIVSCFAGHRLKCKREKKMTTGGDGVGLRVEY